MVNMRSAASVTPGKLAELALLPATTETTVLTAAVGTGVQIATAVLVNVSGSSVNVWVSVVKTGGTAGDANRVRHNVAVAAGASLDLGELGYLNEGDFVSMKASAASAIAVSLTGIIFSDTTGAVLSGIQDDAVGYWDGSNYRNAIGAGSNRYLLAGYRIYNTGGTAGYAAYDTFGLACTDGAMTRLVSKDFDYGSGAYGSVHIFGRANPSSSSLQTLTPTATKAGITLTPVVKSISLSGVASTTGAASVAPTTSVALSLSVTSAVGHRPFFALGLYEPPERFNRRVRGIDGHTSGSATPNWLVLADEIPTTTGAVVATTSNATYHAAVGIDLVPA